MEILAAFDLTKSFTAASELAGCSHHTVANYVALRDKGQLGNSDPVRRPRVTDPYMEKIEEWVEHSKGKIRGDVVTEKLVGLGYQHSQRSARRALKEVKDHYRAGRRRVYRPWIVEPGMWAQWDWGQGPVVEGRQTNLFCAWLAWSRFRVVIPTWDRTIPTTIGCLDQAMTAFGGVPTYWLTDNEKTVTVGHVAGVAVRHPVMVAFGGHYGATVTTCVVRDPESKGGSEATVKIAKADLVPTEANLRSGYEGWGELVEACETFMTKVNTRVHRVTGRAPNNAIIDERQHLHRLPIESFTVVFGQTRTVTSTSTITFGNVSYSVPHQLVGETVWVRVQGNEIVVTHRDKAGPVEVARHARSTPGNPQISDSHYPPVSSGPLNRRLYPTNQAEAEFLALGEGARLWLSEAAAAGTYRLKAKMGDAVTMGRLHGADLVDEALGQAAAFGRFAEGDLASIINTGPPKATRSMGEEHSLQAGTTTWEGFGQ